MRTFVGSQLPEWCQSCQVNDAQWWSTGNVRTSLVMLYSQCTLCVETIVQCWPCGPEGESLALLPLSGSPSALPLDLLSILHTPLGCHPFEDVHQTASETQTSTMTLLMLIVKMCQMPVQWTPVNKLVTVESIDKGWVMWLKRMIVPEQNVSLFFTQYLTSLKRNTFVYFHDWH